MTTNSTSARVYAQAISLPAQGPGDLSDSLCVTLFNILLSLCLVTQVAAFYLVLKRIVDRVRHRISKSPTGWTHDVKNLLRASYFDLGMILFDVLITAAILSLMEMTYAMTRHELGSRIQRLYANLSNTWATSPDNNVVYADLLETHRQVGFQYQMCSALSVFFSSLGSYTYAVMLLKRFKNIRAIMPYPLWVDIFMLTLATIFMIACSICALIKVYFHLQVEALIDANADSLDSDYVWSERSRVWNMVQWSRIGITSRSYALFAVYIVGLDGVLSMLFYFKLKAWQKYKASLSHQSKNTNPHSNTSKIASSAVVQDNTTQQMNSVTNHSVLSADESVTMQQNPTSNHAAVLPMTNVITAVTEKENQRQLHRRFTAFRHRSRMSRKKVLDRMMVAIWSVFLASLFGVLIYLVQTISDPNAFNLIAVLNATSFLTVSFHEIASIVYLHSIKLVFQNIS